MDQWLGMLLAYIIVTLNNMGINKVELISGRQSTTRIASKNITQLNPQVLTSRLTSCNNSLRQTDMRMRLHGLGQLVDDKSVASCQLTCCKLIVKTCYSHAGLLQVILSGCNKSAKGKFTSNKPLSFITV